MAVINEIEIDGISYTLFDINKIYPVGSIYLSTSSTNPSSLFGGTWEQIKDKFLIGAGNSYSGGDTGGSATHTHTNPTTGSTTLTVDQIPGHTHTRGTMNITGGYNVYWSTVNAPSGAFYGTNPTKNGSEQGGGSTTQYYDTINFDASRTWSGNTSSTGGGQGHTHTMGNTGSTSNIPPYLAVYMWKRTA